MMLVLIYNIASWTFIAGILKGWTFAVIFFVFISSFLVHKVSFIFEIFFKFFTFNLNIFAMFLGLGLEGRQERR